MFRIQVGWEVDRWKGAFAFCREFEIVVVGGMLKTDFPVCSYRNHIDSQSDF